MKSIVTAVFLLLASEALCAQICQPPKAETVFYRTHKMEDLYMAQDFDQGKILIVFKSSTGQNDEWSIVDLNAERTYMHSADGSCQYVNHGPSGGKLGYELFQQCLPAHAKLERSGDVDLYSMQSQSDGLEWLVAMKPIPDTEYYSMYFSRFFSKGVAGVGVVPVLDTFGVVYKHTLGLSDPTIFDKDVSACVEGPNGQ
ncbi:hypothetical protein ElyMa_005544800 [Elysia marginata]|uniref:Uncharacterized protein n=1 Tax=Elysia marginata TaxID=1093978 RepID=A0AAV4EXY8_9GAST|nr:hypothetical protein ElyMa_005544800 [Elysia marginata]